MTLITKKSVTRYVPPGSRVVEGGDVFDPKGNPIPILYSEDEKAWLAKNWLERRALREGKLGSTAHGFPAVAGCYDANLMQNAIATWTLPSLGAGAQSSQLSVAHWLGVEDSTQSYVFQTVAEFYGPANSPDWNLFTEYADAGSVIAVSSNVNVSPGYSVKGALSLSSGIWHGEFTQYASSTYLQYQISTGMPYLLLAEEAWNFNTPTDTRFPSSVDFTSIAYDNGLGQYPSPISWSTNWTAPASGITINSSSNPSGSITFSNT